jgi:hypothetical protein
MVGRGCKRAPNSGPRELFLHGCHLSARPSPWERPETPPFNLPDALPARSTLWSKIASNLIRFTSTGLSWQ